MSLPSEPSALRPIHFLQDRREIGCQAIQILAGFVELSVFKEWTCKHLHGVGCVPNIRTVGKVLHYCIPVTNLYQVDKEITHVKEREDYHD